MEAQQKLDRFAKRLDLDREFFEWLGQNVRAVKGRMTFLLANSVVGMAITIAIPLMVSGIVDSVFQLGVWPTATALGLLALTLYRAIPVSGIVTDYLAGRYRLQERLDTITHLGTLSPKNYGTLNSKTVADRITSGINSGAEIMVIIFGSTVFTSLPVAVGALLFLLFARPVAGLVFLIFSVVFLFASWRGAKKQHHFSKEMQKQDGPLLALAQEAIQQGVGIATLGGTPQVRSWYERMGLVRLGYRDNWKRFVRAIEALTSFAKDSPTLFLIFLVLPFIRKGEMTIGDFVALEMYARYAIMPLTELGAKHQSMVEHYTRLKLYLAIRRMVPAIQEAPGAVPLPPITKGVEMCGVTFTYPGKREPALHEVSFKVESGSHVAFVGGNGSGKSTISLLLTRNWDPDQGVVKLDDIPLRDLTLDSVRRRTFLLRAHPTALTGTVRENITLGMPHVTEDEICDACKIAGADFIFSYGLDTQMGEVGSAVSTGELQLIALARLVLRLQSPQHCPSLVILDEATSSLFGVTERDVMGRIIALLKRHGVTIIEVAHRLNLIERCDTIFVMQAGEIVARGRHEELMAICAAYRELHDKPSASPEASPT